MTQELSSGELERWLKRVESKLDKVTEDHENRIRRIERAMYISVGLATAGATSGIGSLLMSATGAVAP